MCGKFTQRLGWRGFVERAELQRNNGAIETVTPMRFASVITLGEDGKRRVRRMRWGLVPLSAADPAKVKPHIHARAETIDEKPTFRDAFRERRGLLAVSTFNEGREITPTKAEQHVLTPKDGAPVAIAVIWERWGADNASSLLSFAMVTVPPSPLVATITDRMPALIEAADWPIWLGESPASLATVKALLRPSHRDLDMQRAVKTRSDQPDLF